jgi:peptidoglycan/LPS O-acetylase OafA/YrhL
MSSEARPPPHHLEALTGLRCIAALMVLLGHGYPVLRFEDNPILGTLLGPLAAAAMPLFFVLSGVVLWLNYAARFQRDAFAPALWSFGVARFARLYPLLLAVVVVGFATAPAEAFTRALPEALLFLTGLQAWIPGHGEQALALAVWSLGHTWSISAEFFLYLTFPALALLLRPHWSRRTLLLALGATLAAQAAMLALVAWTEAVPAVLAPGLPIAAARHWFLQYAPYARLPEFVAGCLTALLALHPDGAARRAGLARGLLPAALLLGLGAIWGGLQEERLVPVARPLLVLAICVLLHDVMRQDGMARRLLSHRALVFGGERSYSLYLIHPLVLTLFIRTPEAVLTPEGLLRWLALLGLALATVMVFSAGSYAMIEVPARAWLRRSLSGPARGRVLAAGGACALAALLFCAFALPNLAFPHRGARLADLAALEAALERHRAARGAYPLAPGFVGAHWGAAGPTDWLPGLVPEFLPRVPVDPRATNIAAAQYVYRSDGRDYKLIALNPEDCRLTVFLAPALSDPARNAGRACLAYGRWTPGAAAW